MREGKIKKVIWSVALIFLVMALLLSRCARPAPAPTPKPARIPFEKQELQKYVVAGSSAGGTSWIMTSAWATIISSHTPMKGSVTEIPGFKDSIERLTKGEIDFFTGAPPSPMSAYNKFLLEDIYVQRP